MKAEFVNVPAIQEEALGLEEVLKLIAPNALSFLAGFLINRWLAEKFGAIGELVTPFLPLALLYLASIFNLIPPDTSAPLTREVLLHASSFMFGAIAQLLVSDVSF